MSLGMNGARWEPKAGKGYNGCRKTHASAVDVGKAGRGGLVDKDRAAREIERSAPSDGDTWIKPSLLSIRKVCSQNTGGVSNL